MNTYVSEMTAEVFVTIAEWNLRGVTMRTPFFQVCCVVTEPVLLTVHRTQFIMWQRILKILRHISKPQWCTSCSPGSLTMQDFLSNHRWHVRAAYTYLCIYISSFFINGKIQVFALFFFYLIGKLHKCSLATVLTRVNLKLCSSIMCSYTACNYFHISFP